MVGGEIGLLFAAALAAAADAAVLAAAAAAAATVVNRMLPRARCRGGCWPDWGSAAIGSSCQHLPAHAAGK